MDGRFLFSGGWDWKISQWEIPEEVLRAARGDPLTEKNKVGPSRDKQKDINRFLKSDTTGQRHYKMHGHSDGSHPQATSSAMLHVREVFQQHSAVV